MDDKIIAFPGTDPLPDNPITINPAKGFCQHNEVALDVHSRLVHCRACGATLEPFDFLLTNARTLQYAWNQHAIVQAKHRELHERVEVLNRELRRLQGRVRTAQQKEAAEGAVLTVRPRSRL